MYSIKPYVRPSHWHVTNKYSPRAEVPVSSGEDIAAFLQSRRRNWNLLPLLRIIAELPYVSPITCVQICFPQCSNNSTLEFCYDTSLYALFPFSVIHSAQKQWIIIWSDIQNWDQILTRQNNINVHLLRLVKIKKREKSRFIVSSVTKMTAYFLHLQCWNHNS